MDKVISYAKWFVDALPCIIPLVLIGLACFAQWDQARMSNSENPMTIGGYPSRGITFSMTTRDKLQLVLGLIILTTVLLVVTLLEYATGSPYFWEYII